MIITEQERGLKKSDVMALHVPPQGPTAISILSHLLYLSFIFVVCLFVFWLKHSKANPRHHVILKPYKFSRFLKKKKKKNIFLNKHNVNSL